MPADASMNGLEWVDGKRLTDLDFADDIALLDSTWTGMLELTRRVEAEAEAVGLRINADKTKVMASGVQGQAYEIKAGGSLRVLLFGKCHRKRWKLRHRY